MSAPVPRTALPWYYGEHPYAPAPRYIHIMPHKGSAIVAKGYASCPQDTAYIVHAANNFPALLEALQDVLDGVGALSNVSEFPNCLNISIERGAEILALIASATGEA